MLTGQEVAAFHALLCGFNGTGQDLVVDGLILGHAQRIDDASHTLGAEQAHQVVLHGQVEGAFAGVALTAGAAAELIVNAAAFVALGAQNAQAAGLAYQLGIGLGVHFMLGQLLMEQGAGFQHQLIGGDAVAAGFRDDLVVIAGLGQVVLGHVFGVAAQHNVGTTACHIGGDGNTAGTAGLGYDAGFFFVVLGVQHLMGNALPLQHGRQQFALFNGYGTYQNRLFFGVAFLNLADDGHVLAPLGTEDLVFVVKADHGAVGGNFNDVQVVNGAELFLFGECGTGHAGQLLVHAEVVLEGDGGQGLAFAVNGNALLGFDGLMQTLGIAAAKHQAAGELVDDDDLAVADHVVDILAHTTVRLNGLVDMVQQGGIFRLGNGAALEILLGLHRAAGGDGGGFALFIHQVVGGDVVLAFLFVYLDHFKSGKGAGKAVGLLIQIGRLVALAGDDQGSTGFVDENGVHLVHNAKEMAALNHIFLIDGHIVTEIVKAHLVVGAVGNVGGVCSLALFLGQVVDDDTALQAHKAIDIAHPLALILGQIVVDGNDVHTLAGQCIQVSGQRGGQGLTFTGAHLGDAALMQDNTTDQLHPEGILTQNAAVGFADGGKCLGQNVIQRFACGQTRLELRGLGLQGFIREGGVFIGQRLDLFDNGFNALQFLGRGIAEELFQKRCHSFILPLRQKCNGAHKTPV